jgi:hypothetical protein
MILNGHKFIKIGLFQKQILRKLTISYNIDVEVGFAKSSIFHLWTFDDCHLDLINIDKEIFSPCGKCFKFFISPKLVDLWANGKQDAVRDKLRDSSAILLSWEQIHNLLSKGHLIGLHGNDHSDFRIMSASEMIDQHESSIQLLESRLGVQTSSFALPFGKITNASYEQVSLILNQTKIYFQKIYLSDNYISPGVYGNIINRRHCEPSNSFFISIAKGKLQTWTGKSALLRPASMTIPVISDG